MRAVRVSLRAPEGRKRKLLRGDVEIKGFFFRTANILAVGNDNRIHCNEVGLQRGDVEESD